jgi:uncharacterized glyoxalase superfamily protein PhnB
MTTFYPSFRYADAPAAIEWLETAFGFERAMIVDGEEEGQVAHAQMRFGDGLIMLGSTRGDEWDGVAGGGWTYVAVEGDIDAHFERARAAGAEIVREPEDQEYGSRDYGARDLEGNVWFFGTYRP